MRYQILKPPSPIDLRSHTFQSIDGLLLLAPPIDEYDSELDAVAAVQAIDPDAIGMPIQINIGSGRPVLMAFVTDAVDRTASLEEHLPFSMFVRPIPDNGRDRNRITQHAQFTQKLWRPPVHRPLITGSSIHSVEVRATDLAMPMHVSAVVGKTANGSPVIAIEVGGVQMSIRFENAAELKIQKSDPPRTVGRDVGASFDPNPL